jgi:2'-5' RNA ligase
MDYGIILCFDKNSEENINDLIKKIAQNNGNTYMLENNILPHLCISLFEYNDAIHSIIELLDKNISNIKSQDIYLDSVGIFNPNVLFLSPVINSYILESNKYINKLLENNGVSKFDKYYIENQWVPHISLGVKLTKKELLDGINVIINNFQNMSIKINKMALAECNPYKEIKIWNI